MLTSVNYIWKIQYLNLTNTGINSTGISNFMKEAALNIYLKKIILDKNNFD